MTISLGDALRPGCLADSSDAGQIGELIELGKLTRLAGKRTVQVDGGGPRPYGDEMRLPPTWRCRSGMCHNAPFYVARPAGDRYSAGYDHITSAIVRSDCSGLRRGFPLLCHAGGSISGCGSFGCQGGHHSQPDRGTCGGYRQGTAGCRGKRMTGWLRHAIGWIGKDV